MDRFDLAIVGAGAAGLMAAYEAGRVAQRAGAPLAIGLFDGALKIGAKILVSGGGRCNVTHDTVDETAFAGATPPAIRKVLRRFDVRRTIEFFREWGVELKREDTGKLFPVSDRAATILEALHRAVRHVGARIIHPARIERITPVDEPDAGFQLAGPTGSFLAGRVILATGGKSLPKSGSDGSGYALAQSLGHSVTNAIFPALVPLVVAPDCFIRGLSGLTIGATLELRSHSGKRLIAFTDSILCTHVGLSGPGVLDMSRHYLAARQSDSAAQLFVNWLPGRSSDDLDADFVARAGRGGRNTIGRMLAESLPQRLVTELCRAAELDSAMPLSGLSRKQRRLLVKCVTGMAVPVTGDRGFAAAEVTAGGIPLNEMRLESLESRRCPGLFFCGEICDVDGRIGGYNFQWAWASGHVAGAAAAQSLILTDHGLRRNSE